MFLFCWSFFCLFFFFSRFSPSILFYRYSSPLSFYLPPIFVEQCCYAPCFFFPPSSLFVDLLLNIKFTVEWFFPTVFFSLMMLHPLEKVKQCFETTFFPSYLSIIYFMCVYQPRIWKKKKKIMSCSSNSATPASATVQSHEQIQQSPARISEGVELFLELVPVGQVMVRAFGHDGEIRNVPLSSSSSFNHIEQRHDSGSTSPDTNTYRADSNRAVIGNNIPFGEFVVATLGAGGQVRFVAGNQRIPRWTMIFFIFPFPTFFLCFISVQFDWNFFFFRNLRTHFFDGFCSNGHSFIWFVTIAFCLLWNLSSASIFQENLHKNK